MKKKRFLIVLSLLILVALGLFCTARALSRPSLSRYQDQFGFSLEGIQVDILDYQNYPAFQDSWSAYVVTAAGKTEGSIFDPSLMSEGLTYGVNQAWGLMSADMKAEKETPIFHLRDDGNYRSRTFINQQGGHSHLYVIFDGDENLYYVLWAGF